MPFSDLCRRQVALLLRALPCVAEEEGLALKGGTAINLFVRDMPRLSVDIDLTYLPVAPRPESLAAIDAAMKRVASRLQTALPSAQVIEAPLHREGAVNKLVVRADRAQVKIEVTPVLRGCVYEPAMRSVSPSVESAFLVSFERGLPEWPLLGLGGVAELPAVRWRQQNLDKLDVATRADLVDRLEQVLHG